VSIDETLLILDQITLSIVKEATKRIFVVLVLLQDIVAMATAEIEADKLILDLKNGDEWHRMIAAANLGSFKDTRAIEPLEEALK
jgi:HEAT repeat protein